MADKTVRGTSVVITGLRPQTDYLAQIATVEDGKLGPWSPALNFTTVGDVSAPNAPSNLQAVARGTSFVATWEAPTQNEDGSDLSVTKDFKDYVLTITASGQPESRVITTTDHSYTLTFDENRKIFGTPQPILTFSIVSRDTAGNVSAPETDFVTNPPPVKPVLTAESGLVVRLSWDRLDDDIETYTVFRDSVAIVSVAGNTLGHEDSTASRGEHTYVLRARDVFGQYTDSDPVVAELIGYWLGDFVAPKPPTNLVVTSELAGASGARASIEVSWDAPVQNVDDTDYDDWEGFRVRWSTKALGPYQTFDVEDDGSRDDPFKVFIDGATPGESYYVGVSAFDRYGNFSDYITELHATVEDTVPPAAPTGVSANGGIKTFTVSWALNTEADLAGYRVYVSDTSGFTPGPTNLVFEGQGNSASVVGLPDNATRYAVVTAFDHAGNESDPSSEESATTITFEGDTTPPGDVDFTTGTLTATAYFHGSTEYAYIEADWPFVSDVIGYLFSYREVGDPTWSDQYVGGSYAKVSGLDPTKDHEVRVKAYKPNGVLSANWSNTRTVAAPTSSNAKPADVTGISATAGVGKVIFSWDEVASAQDYHMQVATDSGFTTGVRNIYARTNEYHYTGVTGQMYYARVRARDQFGNLSNAWSATVSGAVAGISTGDVEELDLGDAAIVGTLSADRIIIGGGGLDSKISDIDTDLTTKVSYDDEIGGLNLLPNSSFEDDDLTGWFGGVVEWGRSTDESRSGDYSMKTDNPSSLATPYVVSGFFPIREGQAYVLSAYSQRSAATRSVVQSKIDLRFYDAGGTFIGQFEYVSKYCPAGEWTRLVNAGVAPVGTTQARAWLVTSALEPGEAVYWDDLKVEEGTVVTAYSPSPADDLATSLAAAADLDAALRGDLENGTGTTTIDGGLIQTDTVDAIVLKANSAIVNGLQIESLLRVNPLGFIESENFNATTKDGYQLSNNSLQFYGGSIILGDAGLNINTETDQLWFGASAFADAKWRVDTDGTMKVGVSVSAEDKFRVLPTGELRIGSGTTPPVVITPEGKATLRNIRITGDDLPNGEALLSAGSNLIVHKTAGGAWETRIAGDMFLDNGGTLTVAGGDITLNSGTMTVNGGNIIVGAGYISSSELATLPATGYRLHADGTLEANNAVISGTIEVTGGNVYSKTEADTNFDASGAAAGVDTSIRTDFTGNSTGTKITHLGIETGAVRAQHLLVQDGNNIIHPMYATMDSRASTYLEVMPTILYSTVTISSTRARYKSTSMKWHSSTSSSSTSVWFSLDGTDQYTGGHFVEPEENYVLSAWVYNDTASAMNLRLLLRTSAGYALPSYQSVPPGVWTRIYTTALIPAGSTLATPALQREGAIGDVYVDGIQLERLTPGLPTADRVPSIFREPASTTINGGQIKTGAIKSNLTTGGLPNWELDLNGNLIARSGTFSGNITGGTINIGGGGNDDFRVDANGNLWIGATTFAAAPFRVSAAGALTATSGTFSGNVNGAAISGSSFTSVDPGGATLTIDNGAIEWRGYGYQGLSGDLYYSKGELESFDLGVFYDAIRLMGPDPSQYSPAYERAEVRLSANTGGSDPEVDGVVSIHGHRLEVDVQDDLWVGGKYAGNLRLASGNIVLGAPSVNSTAADVATSVTGIGISGSNFAGFRRSGNPALYVGRNSSNGEAVRFYRDSNQAGSISVTTSTTTYGTSSDYRLKESVVPIDIEQALSRIMGSEPVEFDWKIDGLPGKGYIAHVLAEHVPEAVVGDKDAVDDEGSPLYQSVDPAKLVPDIHTVVKYLVNEVASLRAQVEALS